jgi:hypothetical protein
LPKFWCPSTGAAPVSPSNHASWTQQGSGFNRKKAVLNRISSSSSTIAAGNGGLNDYTSSGYQWVYGPIAAGTISGTCATRVRGEADIFVDLYTARVAAWIAKPDLTSRGTLISPSTAGNASLWTTSFANYDNTFSCSSVTAVNGDYLVLEVGAHHAAALSDDGFDIEIGDNSATNTNFFDFSDTDLVFWAPAGLAYLENPARYKNGHTVTNNTVSSTGGPIDSYAITSGSLPTGLSLNTVTGTISGTPTSNGTFTATITATNDGGTSAVSVTYTIYTGNSIRVDKLAGVEVKIGG